MCGQCQIEIIEYSFLSLFSALKFQNYWMIFSSCFFCATLSLIAAAQVYIICWPFSGRPHYGAHFSCARKWFTRRRASEREREGCVITGCSSRRQSALVSDSYPSEIGATNHQSAALLAPTESPRRFMHNHLFLLHMCILGLLFYTPPKFGSILFQNVCVQEICRSDKIYDFAPKQKVRFCPLKLKVFI